MTYRVSVCNCKLSVCVILSIVTTANLATFIAAVVLANKPIPTKMCPAYNAVVVNAQNHEQIFQNDTKTGMAVTAMDYLVLHDQKSNPKPLHNITDLKTAIAYNLFELAKDQSAIFIYRNCNSINADSELMYYLEPIIMNTGSAWIPLSMFLGMSLLFVTTGFYLFIQFLKETQKQESVTTEKGFSIADDV